MQTKSMIRGSNESPEILSCPICRMELRVRVESKKEKKFCSGFEGWCGEGIHVEKTRFGLGIDQVKFKFQNSIVQNARRAGHFDEA